MDYFSTLIAVSDDCPVERSVVPAPHNGRKTVAVLQHELLAGRPYELTQEDVLFRSWLMRQPGCEDRTDDEVAALRDTFFAKSQACLRASPLPKKYGFGLLFDAEGRVALCPMESEDYRAGLHREDVKVLKAMRSSRGRPGASR
ncbi:DUF6157 family protein [Nonomuraea diastatica]|uniref:DUF6157 family protein n=1 Tax=Nonomuraea diastatica TaxID=1848329 RepID=UPI001C6FDC40|nr:DUF6157 family protein [Nonomuraea diastatica]